MKNVKNVSLFYTEGKSDKVYHVQIMDSSSGFVVNFQYGRRGSSLQSGTKTASPVEISQAEKIFDKLVSEKMSKGYTPEASGEIFSTEEFKAKKTDILPQLLNAISDEELETLLNDNGFFAQEKFDGERRLVSSLGGKVVGVNRKGLEVPLSDAIRKCFTFDVTLDCEIVGDELFAFDVLSLNGKDVKPLSLSKRLELLDGLSLGKKVKVTKTATTSAQKKTLLKKVKEQNGEGVVFKNKDAAYTSGRPSSGGNALKYKLYKTATFIVGNVTKNKRSVGLLVLDGKKEVEVGKVTISSNFPVPAVGELVEVKYLYAYKGGAVFQPVFLGVRTDLDNDSAVISQLIYKKETEDDEV